MNFSLPHKYVAIPAWVIVSAFEAEPPKSAMLGRYNRLLSLSWDRSDKSTPIMREEDFYAVKNFDGSENKGFLCVSRRQFYEIVREMEGMRWLRSERPRPGFVQFFFHGEDPATVSAENSTDLAKNRTDFELKRIEEEESLKLIKTKSSSSIIHESVRKIAQKTKTALVAETESEKKMRALIEHLPILFDPEIYGGPLEMRAVYLGMVPDYALGWITKAYKERENLTKGGGALGLIVNGLNSLQEPHRYYMTNYIKILPEAYLEAIGEVEYECDYCSNKFDLRSEKEAHEKLEHPYRCMECKHVFKTSEAEKKHYDQVHNPDNLKRMPSVQTLTPSADPSVQESIQNGMNAEQAWHAVLGLLQQEMPRASFETWVRDTQAVRYDRNALTVGVHNQYAKDWLESRLTSTVERMLIGILNREVSVLFVVSALVESQP